MSNRLRNTELTTKPRVIVDGGEYKVQWLGNYSGQACEYAYPNLGDAITLATNVAIARRAKR